MSFENEYKNIFCASREDLETVFLQKQLDNLLARGLEKLNMTELERVRDLILSGYKISGDQISEVMTKIELIKKKREFYFEDAKRWLGFLKGNK